MSFDLPTLPDEWTYLPLDSCCQKNSVTYGVVQPGAALSEGKPIIRVNNFRDTRIDLSDVMYIAPEIEAKYSRTRLKGGEVLLTIVGSVGQVAVVPERFSGFNVARAVAVIHPLQHIAPEWIALCLRSPLSQHLLVSRANTTVQTTINLKDLRALPIPLPPERERCTIAEFVGALDDRITLLRETNATLEAIAQALFKSWFVDFDPVRAKQQGRAPEGMDEATAALFPDVFEESELGLVPKGWKVASLATVMDIAGGTQPPASEFIDSPKDGYIRLIQIRDYETDAHLTYVPHTHKLRTTTSEDIMVARYGASVGRICWGLDGAYNVALVRIVCDPNHREFLRTYLLSNTFQARLAAVSGRSAQAGFNKGDIASFKLVVPCLKLLYLYQAEAWALREKVLHNRQQAQTLATLRDTLLPRLISGQLRLPEAEAMLEEVA